METWQIIVGILLFMLATMVIYAWGMVKQKNQNRDLMNRLFRKGNNMVNKYLKTNPHITAADVEKMCGGISARMPFSKKTAVVVDPKDYTKELLGYMVKTGQLTKEGALYKKAGKEQK